MNEERANREEVERIALEEMMALIRRASPRTERVAGLGMRFAAAALARSLVELDHDLARGETLREAALARLRHYQVEALLDRGHSGAFPLSALDLNPALCPVPDEGPLIVVSNHPGLFDALALFAAIGRDDLAILAAQRSLLDALPNVRRRLLVIEPGAPGGLSLRKALRHVRAGGALLHFPAGELEPDPRVAPRGVPLLHPWKLGLDALLRITAKVRDDLCVVAAMVSGVISRRALTLAKLLGHSDKHTRAIVPLLQLTLPGFGDVDVRVRFGPVGQGGADAAERLRVELEAMAQSFVIS